MWWSPRALTEAVAEEAEVRDPLRNAMTCAVARAGLGDHEQAAQEGKQYPADLVPVGGLAAHEDCEKQRPYGLRRLPHRRRDRAAHLEPDQEQELAHHHRLGKSAVWTKLKGKVSVCT